jgi:sugar phosphate isomerase/epimerase
MQTRRKFLKNATALVGAVGAVGGWSSVLSLSACNTSNRESSGGVFGIQLYSLRDIIQNDFPGLLRHLANFGYKEIESFEGPQGFLWGMDPKECRQYLGDLGLQMIASHVNIFNDFEEKIDLAVEMGLKYLICPYLGRQENLEKYKRFAEVLNEKASLCQAAGLGFAYHNHDYTFEELEGEYPQKILLDYTQPNAVFFELDLYWAEVAGQNSMQWLEKYASRTPLVHIKDKSKELSENGQYSSVDLGTGSMNYQSLIPRIRQLGIPHLIVEQEHFPGGNSLEAVQRGAKFLKSL